MAVEAAPGDARMQHDPRRHRGVLGEIERQGGAPTEGEGDEDLPPLDLDRANFDELRRHGDENVWSDGGNVRFYAPPGVAGPPG